MTEVMPDIDVESVFQELQCNSLQPTPHGGEIVAYFDQHGCNQGWMCRDHYDRYLAFIVPGRPARYVYFGYLRCELCLEKFAPETYDKVYPL